MIIQADSSAKFPLADNSVQCVVTSPPYWGLRDYGMDGQLGNEASPGEYVEALLGVFSEVWRVLRNDGVVWLVLGDSYIGNGGGGCAGQTIKSKRISRGSGRWGGGNMPPADGLKRKDLAGIPFLVALALQEAGWWLRQTVIWEKPNAMPSSVTDRPATSHEYVFLLTKAERYFYDCDAVKEPAISGSCGSKFHTGKTGERQQGSSTYERVESGMRNLRSVWSIPTQQFSGAHYAVFPDELARRCIFAGSAKGDIVLDLFVGSGTTVMVAERYGRKGIGFDLNLTNCKMAMDRTWQDKSQMQFTQ